MLVLPEADGGFVVDVIGIVGGECSGKTTLAAALCDSLDGVVVSEYLRQWVDERDRVPVSTDQLGILAGQESAQEHAISRAVADDRQWVIADPSPFMTAIYSIEYFDDPSLLARGIAGLAENRMTLWCRPDFPWQADGIKRDGPQYRDRVDSLIADVAAAHSLNLIEVRGPLEERVKQALNEMDVVES